MVGIDRDKKQQATTAEHWTVWAKSALSLVLLLFIAACCATLAGKWLRQGPPTAEATAEKALSDGLIVYYLHGNTRCDDCTNLEQGAREAIETGFARELKAGRIQWRAVNYEQPGNEHYATDYDVVAPTVVLVTMAGGKQTAWNGLPEAWQFRNDRPKLIAAIQAEIRTYRGAP